MDNFIGNNVKFLALYGQPITALLILLCLIAIYFTVRRNKYYLPNSFLSGLGVTILFLLSVVFALVFARITMVKPGVMAIINQLEEVKEKAPALSFKLVRDDSPRQIEDYRGKVVLVNFWATWCKPCIAEMPDLNKLQADYRDKGLEIIVISDEKRDRLLRYHEKNEMTVNSGYLEQFDWAEMGSERPVTFLLDKNGVVQEYFTGAWDYEYFEAKVTPYLN
ncbi:MAG: TlpA disulfide reductase family protein [Cyclobacteriaceae bacterium]